jgi:CO/xanthine dehydrogenase Mo-binding subunit
VFVANLGAMAVNAALGGAVKRREDPRLITGAGAFTDDQRPAGCLHAVFVRSPVAHARIARIDTTAASSIPGVVRVFTADDLHFASETSPRRAKPRRMPQSLSRSISSRYRS